MTDATFGVTPGTFDPTPPPRLLWVAAFVAVVAVHAGVALFLLDRPMDSSAHEAPEAVTLIDLPPAPPAPGDSALQLPASEQLEAAPASAPDAVATSEAPDEAREVSEAAAIAEPIEEPPPPEPVPEAPPLTAPAPMLEIPPTLEPPPPLVAPQPMLEIPPALEPPPVEPPPEPPIEEAPVVPEATVVLPSVIPPPMVRPEPPQETSPPARRETARTREKPQQRQKAPVRENASTRAAGAPAADKTVTGKPKSGAAPRAAGGGTDASAMRRFQAQVRADIQNQSRSLSTNLKGRVVVRFTFSRNGAVAGVSVAKSSGSARLDQIAVQSVRRASPLPAAPEGVPGARFTWSMPILFD